MDIIARLDGFHKLMSYQGATGKVMKGSGIEELFNKTYAENTVQHIISGKVVSRALQAHLPAESACISILFEDTKAVNIAKVNEFVSILEKSLEEIETFCQTPEVQEMGATLEKRMQELREREREREREITNCKNLASVLASYSSIEEIHYCPKNIRLVTSLTVSYRYAESLWCMWASKLCEKRPYLCSAEQFENGKHTV